MYQFYELQIIIKIIGIIILLLSAYLIGYVLSEGLRAYMAHILQLEKLLTELRSYISYQLGTMPEAFEEISKSYPKDYGPFFAAISNTIRNEHFTSLEEIGKKHRRLLVQYNINRGLIEDLVGFVSQLGYLDKEMQLKNIDFFRERIVIKKEALKICIDKKCRMYKAMGILTGMLIGILLA